MRRMVAILFAAALVSVSVAKACSGIHEDLQKRAQEEVEKGRQQVELKVQEERFLGELLDALLPTPTLQVLTDLCVKS